MKLGFSDTVALPGSAVHLHLQAAPRSLCSIRAVDQSVLLLRPEAELSRANVSLRLSPAVIGEMPFEYLITVTG